MSQRNFKPGRYHMDSFGERLTEADDNSFDDQTPEVSKSYRPQTLQIDQRYNTKGYESADLNTPSISSEKS